MLKLSKAQYKALCSDCAAEMMRGAGHGGKIPDFSGTDMKFYVSSMSHSLAAISRSTLVQP